MLVPPALVLLGTALAVNVPAGAATLGNPGTHGFSEILYAFSSAANNNGSAFGGLGAMNPFWDVVLGIAIVECVLANKKKGGAAQAPAGGLSAVGTV